MFCSLNEVESYARRAARGAGLSFGLAEEAGRAARWLCARAMPGVALMTHALRMVDGRPYAGMAPVANGQRWRAPGGALCPVCAGAALSDHAAVALSGAGGIELQELIAPLLLAPFVALASGTAGAVFELAWPGVRVWVAADALWVQQGDVARLYALQAERVRVQRCDAMPPVALSAAATGGVRVADADWQVLCRLAHRTYVPASEESRTRGAGAGTSDND